MRPILALMVLSLLSSGCGPRASSPRRSALRVVLPRVYFMQVGGDTYPTKPPEYEVPVYAEDAPPEREYRVIGVMYVEVKEDNLVELLLDESLVEALRKEARTRGADAVVDLKRSTATGLVEPEALSGLSLEKRAEAKAVVFVNE